MILDSGLLFLGHRVVANMATVTNVHRMKLQSLMHKPGNVGIYTPVRWASVLFYFHTRIKWIIHATRQGMSYYTVRFNYNIFFAILERRSAYTTPDTLYAVFFNIIYYVNSTHR